MAIGKPSILELSGNGCVLPVMSDVWSCKKKVPEALYPRADLSANESRAGVKGSAASVRTAPNTKQI